MKSSTEMMTDLEGNLIRVSRIEFSLVEDAQSAGRVMAWNGKAPCKNRIALAKRLRVKVASVSSAVWDAYIKAYEENA